MPFLDVSSVLTDPMFQDTSLRCVRRSQTVGEDGLAVNTETTIPFAGVVTNNSGDTLKRTPEGSRVEGDICIHTRFILQDGRDGKDADQIKWQNRLYNVVNVADWSTYGRGFTAATCQLVPLSGGPA
jgi:hypothetical protein